MQPPHRFMEQLKAYDAKLVVGWNPHKGRWIIARPSGLVYGSMTHIMTVQNSDGTYRPLDQRTLDHLKMIDSWRIGREEQIRQIEAVMDADDMASEKETDQIVEAYLDKALWALKRDIANVNLGNYTRKEASEALAFKEKTLDYLHREW